MEILSQFLTGLGKFRLKKALTMRMLTCKLPWFVIVGKSGSKNSNMGSPATPYLQVTWHSQILDQKSAEKKALTMVMLIYKLTLIVTIVPQKLHYE